MNNFGSIVDSILRIGRIINDDERKRVESVVRTVYYEIARIESWREMRGTVDLDCSEADANGCMVLPSNLIGIDGVRSTDDSSIVFIPVDGYEADAPEDDRYRWEYAGVSPVLFASLEGFSIDQGATIATLASDPSSDWADEYIQFGQDLSNSGYFKIVSVDIPNKKITLDRLYSGESVSNVPFQVRPEGTRLIRLINADESNHTGNVRVYGWFYPAQLFDNSQIIQLPTSRPLELQSIVRYIGTELRRESAADRYRSEYESEIARARSLNPKFKGFMPPRDVHGNVFTFSGPKNGGGLFKRSRPSNG